MADMKQCRGYYGILYLRAVINKIEQRLSDIKKPLNNIIVLVIKKSFFIMFGPIRLVDGLKRSKKILCFVIHIERVK